MFENSFAHGDGRAELIAVDNHFPAELTDEEYPIYLTTGRVLSHYLTGVQTRRSHTLASRDFESFVELHPKTAKQYGLADGQLAVLTSRRGEIVVRCKITRTIRDDTVFVPMHWGDTQNVNVLTNQALDPTCRMPGFKVCAVRIKPFIDHHSY
jgi:assimilatory nitrate reductase catalytic subunit